MSLACSSIVPEIEALALYPAGAFCWPPQLADLNFCVTEPVLHSSVVMVSFDGPTRTSFLVGS